MTLAHGHRVLLLIAAIAALAITFMSPRANWPGQTYRYVFVFDISQSMNVADVSHGGEAIRRIDLAKQRTVEALKALPCGTEAGVALFTGHRPFLLLKPVEICANFAELTTMIERIEWRMTWKARSEIAKGLFKSVELVALLDEATRVVFFTDGHEAPPLHPEVVPRFEGVAGEIKGLVVGVGGETPVRIPKFDEDNNADGYFEADEVMQVDTFTASRGTVDPSKLPGGGTEHLSALQESYLEGLAEKTGLLYHRLDGGARFNAALQRRALGFAVTAAADMRPVLAALALVTLLITVLAAGSATAQSSRPARY